MRSNVLANYMISTPHSNINIQEPNVLPVLPTGLMVESVYFYLCLIVLYSSVNLSRSLTSNIFLMVCLAVKLQSINTANEFKNSLTWEIILGT